MEVTETIGRLIDTNGELKLLLEDNFDIYQIIGFLQCVVDDLKNNATGFPIVEIDDEE
ncbi:MAG: hypothetical protein ACLFTR_03345 [Candidatus Woesearchaeota archaeon]